MSENNATSPTTSWPDYRAVWRWHFYASLFCIPFVIVLSLSGAIYLFKPQIEAWLDRPYDNLPTNGQTASVEAQVRAAWTALPDSKPSGYELPETPNSAGRVMLRKDGESIRVYVHPETLQVLHRVPEDERLMRWIFKLHGELLIGDRGSNLVELAASWTIIMLVTGLYLWWPRNGNRLAGVVYPRLRNGSRIFWRDLHSVTGIWIFGLALFLLLTGLPWAKFWGNYFKSIRRLTGTSVAQQDWTTGSERPTRRGEAAGHGGEHGGHAEGGGASRAGGGGSPGSGNSSMPKDLAAFDRVAATVRPLCLAPPVIIAPPGRGSKYWTAKSMTQNRPYRVTLEVDGTTGDVVSREDFSDRHLVDRLVGIGIAAHEGQLFGWANQLLGLLTAAGLILLSISGVILWWRRRDQGVLGAPKILLAPRFSRGLVLLIVLLGVYLPLFGVSLVVVLVLEKFLLARIPRVRDWLGLRASEPVASS